MIPVIVLAAGASRRMAEAKLLLELGGEPLLRRAARCAADAEVGPVVVVIGGDEDLARRALEGVPCAIVADPALPHRGMNASLAAGVAALPPAAGGAVVLLADMPLVTAAAVRALVARHRETGAPIVTTRYGEALAPPVLYDRALLAALAAGGEGDGHGRALVRRHRAEAEVVDAPAHALADVDVPADLDRVRALLRAGRSA